MIFRGRVPSVTMMATRKPPSERPPRRDDDGDTSVVTKTKPDSKTKLKKPQLFKVLLHNDNYTTRDFVVFLLMTVFAKQETDAVQIMLHVHHNGVGVAGVYTKEVAETKVETVISLARQNEFPLLCTMEPE